MFPIRPAVQREPLHASITAEQISTLVDTFYSRIRAHPRLGPIFAARVGDDWTPHLDKMKSFWRSVLLKTGEYKGKPVPTHFAMKEVEPEDFRIWLDLFRTTALEIFDDPEAARLAHAQAKRIAQSLWMAMFATPFDRTPDYLTENG
ncbi:group III truncated hemoglobin [Breoghania sp. L-A4]|uniref:group III truncated hemoglobin n=1 Tax=Breoghania sp. L-A4 TaxID=2304600 RepID=UPI000E360419|nr:group III truncated hemoglobin [Breoghania sp. L-A4]AXS39418.1 group III truncated hemoglobin [Breoghania sp. L-A4]